MWHGRGGRYGRYGRRRGGTAGAPSSTLPARRAAPGAAESRARASAAGMSRASAAAGAARAPPGRAGGGLGTMVDAASSSVVRVSVMPGEEGRDVSG